MSGRHEKELRFENRAQKKLETLPAVVTEYYYAMMGAGSSSTTIDGYINYIQTFLNFTFPKGCSEQFYEKVTSTHINRYIASCRTKEVNGKTERLSDSIRAVRWSALNSFFQFLVPNYIKANPVANTQRPKIRDNPNVTYLTVEEIGTLYQYVAETAKARFKNRDLCFLKLGFSTGLRISAIMQIDIDDIDFNAKTIKVVEKGDRDYQVMFGDNLKQQMQIWLQDRAKLYPNCQTNALFVSQKGERLSVDQASKIIAKYSDAITDKKVTPHVMRHSCATNLYEKTNDIYICAKQLNHKNVTTTQRYAEVSKSKQKEVANMLDELL